MTSPTDSTECTSQETTHDAFLGGKVYVHQPKRGRHRAGLDAVYLAGAGAFTWAATAVVLFGITLTAQRYIPGT